MRIRQGTKDNENHGKAGRLDYSGPESCFQNGDGSKSHPRASIVSKSAPTTEA